MPTVLARYGVVDREINFRTLSVRFVGERAPQAFPLCWMGMIRTPTRERIPGGDQVRLQALSFGGAERVITGALCPELVHLVAST